MYQRRFTLDGSWNLPSHLFIGASIGASLFSPSQTTNYDRDTAGVFVTHHTVVAGVCGNSDSSDRPSLHVMEELSQILRELTQVYQQAQHILLAGDFNVALEDEDTRRDKTTNL